MKQARQRVTGEQLEVLLREAYRTLLAVDPGILAIVQFGSSVYAPEAARPAVMAYLGTEETRWESLRRGLPPEFAKRFGEIADNLHVFYRAPYPSPPEFRGWKEIVEEFTSDLEAGRRQEEG